MWFRGGSTVSGILEQVALWIEQIIVAIGYPGIALVMFTENVFPPIPSEVVMPFAGFALANQPQLGLSFVGIVVAGTLGSVLGAVVLYYIGLWADELIIRRFVRSYGRWFLLSERDVDKTLSYFDRYGHWVVFFGRLIPIVRSLISVPAGMNRMPLVKFLIFTTLGSAIWTTLLAYAGVLLGANWEQVIEWMDQYQKITLVIVAIIVVLFIVWRVRSMRRGDAATATE